MTLGRGSVILVDLDPTLGHEQRGIRPCVVVSDSEGALNQRFPLICVVPISGTAGTGLLYPALLPGASGLGKASFALIDQIRAVDKRRIRRVFGRISALEITMIDEGLRKFLRLPTSY